MGAPWVARAKELVRASAFDFGGILVFYLLLYTLGLKAAIGGTILFLIVDAIRRKRQGLGFPRIYILSSALAVVFGIVDLISDNPFMIKYEAVISNLVLGAMFAAGARGRSILQELVEQREGARYDDQPDIARFFQLMTLLWAGYFIVKAVVYVWLGQMLTIERTMEIRPIIGTVSLVAMMGVTMQGRRLFALAGRLGLLPARPARKPDASGA
jgi:intracellular septation protein A